MKKLMLMGIAILLLILLFSVAGEAVELNNLVTLPTADVMTYQGAVGGEITPDKKEVELAYKLDSRLEVGGVLNLYDNSYEIGPLVKLAMTPETKNQPAISAGIKNRDMYLVFSKTLKYGFRGHMGIGNGKYEDLFIGINKIINPVTVELSDGHKNNNSPSFPPMNLMAEYVDDAINLGVRMNLKKSYYVDIGIMDLNEIKAGFSFAF